MLRSPISVSVNADWYLHTYKYKSSRQCNLIQEVNESNKCSCNHVPPTYQNVSTLKTYLYVFLDVFLFHPLLYIYNRTKGRYPIVHICCWLLSPSSYELNYVRSTHLVSAASFTFSAVKLRLDVAIHIHGSWNAWRSKPSPILTVLAMEEPTNKVRAKTPKLVTIALSMLTSVPQTGLGF